MYVCTITTGITCHIHVSLSNNINTVLTVERNLKLYMHIKKDILLNYRNIITWWLFVSS